MSGYALKSRHARLPPPPLNGLQVDYNVPYGQGAKEKLDIYAPQAALERPVVIYLHGGGWTGGDKQDQSWVAAALARRGYVTVTPNYRLYPEVVWPAFLQDNASAVRWVRDNIARYGGDPGQLLLMGHSAGAFNAVSLAVDRRWLAQVGMDPRRDLKAVAGLSGPYNLLPLTGKTEKVIFGPHTGYSDTLSLIDGQSPPILMVVGDHDVYVDASDNVRTAARIRETGGRARAIAYHGLAHDDTADAIAGTFHDPTHSVAADVLAFIGAHVDHHSAPLPAAMSLLQPDKNIAPPDRERDAHSKAH